MLLRVIVFIVAVLSFHPALAAGKVALLIGNARYSAPATVLKNPPNDVAALKATLAAAGFDVTVAKNLSRAAMSEALAAFEEKAAGAEVGLVYYSGHGIEVNGDNFLLPVDVRLASDRDVKYEAILLDDVLAALSRVTKLKLVLLDACRDNPFLTTMKRVATKGIPTRGLARVDSAETNLLIGYATAPGDVALDGEGDNSPYAQALARHLVAPGHEVMTAMQAVARDVYGATAGRQRPFIAGSLFETVMLGPQAADDTTATNLPAIDPCRDAATHWSAVRGRKNKALLEEHLRLFGACPFAAVAKTEITALDASQKTGIAEPSNKLPENLSRRMKAAEAGDVEEMVKVADHFRRGLGIPSDELEAMAWYLKAAHAGEVRAMANATSLHKKGIGTASEYRKAMAQGCKVLAAGDASQYPSSWLFPTIWADVKSMCRNTGQ